MLEIKNITKVYKGSGVKATALDGVSVNFRKSEFVSILGPSGSGKTTLLNIIGGLDHYTTGDLVIDGVSTRRYKDADWDSYRNHKIGFIFQSYNLIPHQTILKNVALALNLSGINGEEAEKRAKAALKEVGLEKHINKRPAQLSGGQMQRVAIARALVNNPDILLADEPTGALDSETSVQIMDLLKKIADKKLVIMVTHNPELAKEYSTRIIELKDGEIISDSQPFTEEKAEKQRQKRKKTKMSLLTSFRLSASNLLTKKARTILVAVAGSIGIIGIALVLAISNGFQRYVDDIETETLTSYPLTIQEESSDITSLLLSVSGENNGETEAGTVKENQIIANMMGSLSINDLKSFKQYLEENQEKYKDDVSSLSYNYSVEPLIYTHDETGVLAKLNPSDIFSSMMGGSSSLLSSYSSYTSVFSQLDSSRMNEDYKILAGKYPENYNEMLIVLKDENAISDLMVYYLGLRDTSELKTMVTNIMSGETVEINNEPKTFTYEDLMNVELKLLNATDLYQYNSEYNIYEKMTDNAEYMENLYNNSVDLKIVGVATVKDESTMSLSSSGIMYLPELTDYVIDTAAKTNIVKTQLANLEIDVFSNKRFDEEDDSLGLDFADFVTIDEAKMESAFGGTIDQTQMKAEITNYMTNISGNISADTTPAKTAFDDALRQFLSELTINLPDTFYQNEVEGIVDNYLNSYTAAKTLSDLNQNYVVPVANLKEAYAGMLKSYLNAYIQVFVSTYGQVPEFVAEHPELFADPNNYGSLKDTDLLATFEETYLSSAAITTAEEQMAQVMTEAKMKQTILTSVSNLTSYLTDSFAQSMNIDPSAITGAFQLNVTEDEITRIVTAMLTETDATAQTNLISLGYQDKNEPTSIEIYFTSFEGKENFLKLIDDYNSSVTEEKQIKYNDTTGILMSSVKTIVDAVTYVLIGFVSVSLVVSSIMIGVITYISVYERTKEIGILRALGASKRNISTIFNAETLIIGFLSGIFAITISYLLILLINTILLNLTGITNLSAYLTPVNSLILVLLSVGLTLIGGLIPAKSASKKDPVEALRSE